MYYKLDSLRGVAAVLVVLLHSPFSFSAKSINFIGNAILFVDFFFILSGFVMAFAYAEKIREGISFGRYSLLRIGRIYPLHLLTLLIWVPYVAAKWYVYKNGYGGNDPLIDSNGPSFLSHLFLVNSIGFSNPLAWNYPAWSISAEMVAYATFFFFIKWVPKRSAASMAIVVSIAAYAIVFMLFSKFQGSDYRFIRGLAGFYLGVTLFDLSRLRVSFKLPTQWLEILVVIGIVVSVSMADTDLGIIVTLFSFACAILVFSSNESGLIGRVLDGKFFVRMGAYSYSIYMNHAIVISIVSNVVRHLFKIDIQEGVYWHTVWVNLLLVVFVCWLSKYTYEYIEKPCRNFARRLVQRA